MQTRTLVLTKSYQAHLIVSWYEAIGMIFTNKVDVIEEYPGDDNIAAVIPQHRAREFAEVCKAYPAYSGGDLIVRVPAVIRVRTWEGGVKRGVKFSRTNVFTRDNYRCQYCGTEKTPQELNYDHVTPRKQGGRTVWENITTCCYRCNSQKGGRTPEQAGMKLRRQPFKPRVLPMLGPRIGLGEIHELWVPYLPVPAQVA